MTFISPSSPPSSRGQTHLHLPLHLPFISLATHTPHTPLEALKCAPPPDGGAQRRKKPIERTLQMNRYEVTAVAPTIGKVKHVIKARERIEAVTKMKRAHPGAASFHAKRIEPVVKDASDRPAKITDARSHAKAMLLDAIPPKGATIPFLADAIRAAPMTVRAYVRELEAEGHVTRRRIDIRGTMLIERVA